MDWVTRWSSSLCMRPRRWKRSFKVWKRLVLKLHVLGRSTSNSSIIKYERKSLHKFPFIYSCLLNMGSGIKYVFNPGKLTAKSLNFVGLKNHFSVPRHNNIPKSRLPSLWMMGKILGGWEEQRGWRWMPDEGGGIPQGWGSSPRWGQWGVRRWDLLGGDGWRCLIPWDVPILMDKFPCYTNNSYCRPHAQVFFAANTKPTNARGCRSEEFVALDRHWK